MAGNSISIIIRAQNDASDEIDDIRLDLRRLDRSADDASDSSRRLGGSLGGMASIAAGAAGAVATVGGSLMGIATSALTAGGNFEEAMNEFAAANNLKTTSAAFQEARDAAKEMGTTTSFSATEAAGALTFLGRAGFDTAEAVSALPNVLNLAQASGMALGRTADIASNILSGFGMEVSELAGLNDVLAATSNAANVNLGTLGESFKYVGPVASGAGLSIQQTAAAIGTLGTAGIQASSAGTALRAGILSLQSPADKAQDALDRLGVTVKDSDGNMKDFVTIMREMNEAGAGVIDWKDIVGREAASAFQILTNNSGDLEQFAENMHDVDGAVDQAADTMSQGFNAALKEVGSAMEGLNIAIFDAGLGDLAVRVLKDLANAIRNLAGNEAFITRVSGAIDTLGAVMSYTIPKVQAAGTLIATVFDNLDNNTTTNTANMTGSIAVWSRRISGTLQTTVDFVGSVMATMASDTALYSTEMTTAQQIWVQAVANSLSFFQDVWNQWATWLSSAWNTVVQSFVNADTIEEGFYNLGTSIGNALNILGQALMMFLNEQWGRFVNYLKAELEQLRIDAANAIRQVVDDMVSGLSELPGRMTALLNNAMTSAIESIRSRIPDFGAMASSMANRFSSSFANVLGISSPSKVFNQYGFDMVEGAIVGINANAPSAISAVEGLANQIEAVLRDSVETTKDYVSAVSLEVQTGLRAPEDAIPLLEDQLETLQGRLRDVAGEDGAFLGSSEHELEVAQSLETQIQAVESQLDQYRNQLDRAAQASERATQEQERLREATEEAEYQWQRTSGAIDDATHLANLQQQAQAIRETNGETVEYFNTLTQIERVEQQIARAQEQREQEAGRIWKEAYDARQEAREEQARQEEQEAREQARRQEEAQRRAEQLNETMLEQAENLYTAQVVQGYVSLEDQIARVEGQLAQAERGTSEWLSTFQQLEDMRSQREGNLFELELIEGDFSDLEELQMRLERTNSTIDDLSNQRGSDAYLAAVEKAAELEEAITEELREQRAARLDNAQVEAERVRRRQAARAQTGRLDDDSEQYQYTASVIQITEGAFTSLADALAKTKQAGVGLTSGFFDYLSSSRFADVVNGNVVNLTQALYDLGQVSRVDTRTALEEQRDSLETLLPQLVQGSEAWHEYAEALANVNSQLADMDQTDREVEVQGIMNETGQATVDMGVQTGQISPEQASSFYAAEEERFAEKRGQAQDSEEWLMFSQAMLDAADASKKYAEMMPDSQLKTFGDKLLNIATEQIPYLGGIIQGFASGGPIGALMNFFMELIGESEGLKDVIKMVGIAMEPLILVIDQLFTALQPIIKAVLDLFLAFQPILQILMKILAPVLKVLGKIIGALADAVFMVINGFVAVYNALLGWLLGRIDKVERNTYDLDEDEDKSKDSDSSSGSSDKGPGETDFGGIPPSVQLAIATPLVDAAEKMLHAAKLMVSAFGGSSMVGAAASMGTGSNLSGIMQKHTLAMDRHSLAMDKASQMFDRLITEGISVTAQTSVDVTDERSGTLGLR